MKRRWILAVIFLFISLIIALAVFLYPTFFTGNVAYEILPDSSDREDDFFFSPEIIPDQPRNESGSPYSLNPDASEEEIACFDAKQERKIICDVYLERFPEGCGIFGVFSGCNLLREICTEAQQKAEDICSLSEE